MNYSSSGYGQVVGSCLRANEPLGSTKENFLNMYGRIRFSKWRLLRGVNRHFHFTSNSNAMPLL
jgi:hypothetical protein